MDTESLKNILQLLKNNSYDYSLEGHIVDTKYYLRGIYINNCEDDDTLKNLLDSDILKKFSTKKTYAWNLGERKKISFLKLKDELGLHIYDFEAIQTDSYSSNNQLTS